MNVKKTSRADRQISRRIRMHRLANDMSQAQLAGAVGVSWQQVQKYENGINRVGAGRVAKIASVLGVSIGQLLGPEDSSETSVADGDRSSDMDLLCLPGAPHLLQRYASIEDSSLRDEIVRTIETMAHVAQSSAKD